MPPKPLQTVGSLVQQYKKAGMSEDQIAKEFEKQYGAPHYNLPEGTTLRQAYVQSPRAIRKRGVAAARPELAEEIYFPFAATGGREDRPEFALEPEPPALGSETLGIEEESTSTPEETSLLGDVREAALAVEESKRGTELRGGITDLGESLARTGGFFTGMGEKLYEMTPFGEEAEREAREQQLAMETPEAAAARRRQETAEREAWQKNVVDNPKSTLADMIKNTPTGLKIRAAQEEALKKYEGSSLHGAFSAFTEDAGNLIMFLPRLIMAPFEEFEAPKEKSSFAIGKEAGKEMLPTMATAAALTVPGVDFYDQLRAAPLSTMLMYIPAIEGGAAALKALPGAGRVASKLGAWRLAAGEKWTQALGTTADVVARRTGQTSQFVMDKFYNRDPKITALMEEAFAEGAGTEKALKKLSDIFGEKVGGALEAGPKGAKPVVAATADVVTSLEAGALDRPSTLSGAIAAGQVAGTAEEFGNLSKSSLARRLFDEQTLNEASSKVTLQRSRQGLPVLERELRDASGALILDRNGMPQLNPEWVVAAAQEAAKTAKVGKGYMQMARLLDFSQDAIEVLVRNGYTMDEAGRALQSALGQNRNVKRVPFADIEEWLKAPTNARGNAVQATSAEKAQFLGMLTEELSTSGDAPYRLRTVGGSALNPTFAGASEGVQQLARALDDALGAGGGANQKFKFTAADLQRSIQSGFARLADEVQTRKHNEIFRTADEADKVVRLADNTIDLAQTADKYKTSLPNVLGLGAQELNNLTSYVRGIAIRDSSYRPLLQRLEEMKPLKGVATDAGTPINVSRPLAYLQEVQENQTAFRKQTENLMGRLNSFLKAGAIPLNPPSLISNIIGNAIAASVKFGTTPFTEMELVRAYLADYARFLKGEAPSKTLLQRAGLGELGNMADDATRARAYRAAQRSGLFGGDKMNADLGLQFMLDETRNLNTMPGPVRKVLSKTFDKALAAGGKLMEWGDQGAMLRTFTAKFDDLATYASNLAEGESISFPTGVNSRGTLTRQGSGYLFSERVTGAKYASTRALSSGAAIDDVLAKGAGAMAGGLIFDYSRTPGYLNWLARQPIVGAGSPFYTYGFKALSAPPFKRGMLNFMLSSADGVSSTSNAVNRAITQKALQDAGRKAMMVAASKVTAEDPDVRKLYGGDPVSPGALRLTGRGTEEAANIARFSSANWFEGTQTYLNILEGIADSLEDLTGTSKVDKYLKIATDPNTKATEEEQTMAYNLAVAEVKRRGLNTPETVPAMMKLLGIGGSQAFEFYAKLKDAAETGDTTDLGEAMVGLVTPGGVRRLVNIGNVIFGTEKGVELLAKGRPEDANIDYKNWREKAKYAFTQGTGLGAVPVDSAKTAKRVSEAWKKEMMDRLDVWKKKRMQQIADKYKKGTLPGGYESAAEKADDEYEELKDILEEAVTDWLDGLEDKGVKGVVPAEEYVPPAEEPTQTTEEDTEAEARRKAIEDANKTLEGTP